MSLSTGLQKIQQKIYPKDEQQAAIVHLGELALSDSPLSNLMEYAAEQALQVLPVEFAAIWELLEDRENLLFMAGSGWQETLRTHAYMPLHPQSLESLTLASRGPVIVMNLSEETRFKPAHFVLDHGAVSGISVLIGTLERPYGILEVFSRELQSFTESDILYLQSAANVMALVLRQSRLEENLVARNQLLRKELIRTQFMTPSGHFEWDRYEIKNRMVESRERERLRLAQDLHDAPIQDLYGLIYQLDDLKDFLGNPDGGMILDECSQTVHKVVNSLRTICRDLRPPSLSPFGLEVAIRDHVEKFCELNPDIKVHLDMMHDKEVLSDPLRLGLYRVYQQAFHNIARHAQATEVHIRFKWDDEMICLEIEDNGSGFEVPRQWAELLRDEHFGILGMAEQVENMRGKLEILSSVGSGTLVRALIPRS